MPEIFDRGISCVVRRAVIIGNGASGAEHQCIGLVRALGLTNSHTLHRVNRPNGGFIDIHLRWLSVPIHKKVDFVLRHIQSNWRRLPLPGILSQLLGDSDPLSPDSKPPVPRKGHGLHALIMDEKPVPEADAYRIAALALEDLDREGPLLIVASGRDTISVAAAVKRLAPEATFVVQIQHPRWGLDRFDMVLAPIHDYHILSPTARQEVPKLLLQWITPQQPPDKHVVLTVGALHHADASTLRAAATAWQSELAPLAKPLLIVDVGFPTRYCRYREDLALELLSALKLILSTCGSYRITFSQRTPSQIVNLLTRELGQHPKVFIWDGRGPNPHFGHLAWGGCICGYG